MARNSRWDNPPRMNQNSDRQDSIKYSRYENDQRGFQRDHYNERETYEHPPPRNQKESYEHPPPRNQKESYEHPPPRNQRESYEYPPPMRPNQYGPYKQEMPPRSTQEYPLPLTLPIPLAVPASLEYEPV